MADDFEKERREWWKAVYIDSINNARLNGSIKPNEKAVEALKDFDKQFKEENSGDDDLNKYHEKQLVNFNKALSK